MAPDELLADAPAPDDQAAGSSADHLAERPEAPHEAGERLPRGRRRRTAVAALAAAVAVGGVVGWSSAGSWRSTQTRGALLTSMDAAASVVRAVPHDQDVEQSTLGLTVQVTNKGPVPFELLGGEGAFTAASIDRVDGVPVTVQAGGAVEVVVNTTVICPSPRALRLPPLSIRGEDGVRRSLEVAGAAATLIRLCSTSRRQPLVAATAATQDGPRLRIQLQAPGGRSTRIQEVRLGGVLVRARPQPLVVDGENRTLWLEPAAECDPSWIATALPRSLEAVVDAGGGNARLQVDVGPALSRWLLGGPCASYRLGAAP